MRKSRFRDVSGYSDGRSNSAMHIGRTEEKSKSARRSTCI